MLNNTNQLNAQQLKDLEALSTLSKKKDGSTPNLYWHILSQPRSFPASVLYYEQEHLIGFLSVYFFYEDAVELSLLVHPSYRRQHIATQLLTALLPLIQAQHYQKLVFSSPHFLNNAWLKPLGFSYLHSEYYMERDDLSPIWEHNQNLSFRNAISDDIPLLATLDEACFPEKNFNSKERFQHLIDGREYQVIIAYNNNIPIGKAHIRWQSEGATLSDIAIRPDQQGKGLGTSLIAHCINLALSEGKPHLNLDVETHNMRALNLYTRLGFATKNATDYWRIALDELVSKLKKGL